MKGDGKDFVDMSLLQVAKNLSTRSMHNQVPMKSKKGQECWMGARERVGVREGA